MCYLGSPTNERCAILKAGIVALVTQSENELLVRVNLIIGCLIVVLIVFKLLLLLFLLCRFSLELFVLLPNK